MYDRVADPDSGGMLPELAAGVARRSLEIEAAPAGSTPCASNRSVTKPGLCAVAPRLGSCTLPFITATLALRHFALGGRCRDDACRTPAIDYLPAAHTNFGGFAASDIAAAGDWVFPGTGAHLFDDHTGGQHEEFNVVRWTDRRIGRGPRDRNRRGHWPRAGAGRHHRWCGPGIKRHGTIKFRVAGRRTQGSLGCVGSTGPECRVGELAVRGF